MNEPINNDINLRRKTQIKRKDLKTKHPKIEKNGLKKGQKQQQIEVNQKLQKIKPKYKKRNIQEKRENESKIR